MSTDDDHQCPICEADVPAREDNEAFPFCSNRCKNADLGKWLGGEYAFQGRPASPREVAEKVQDDSE